jgi:hypothetical protein
MAGVAAQGAGGARYEKTKQTQTDRGQKIRFLFKNRGACNKKQKEVVRLEVYIEG